MEIDTILSTEVQDIIDGRTEFIENNYCKIRERFWTPYEWPELDPIRHEICLSIIFGISQAAITLTNHLLESSLKYALIINDARKNILPHNRENVLTSYLNMVSKPLKQYDYSDLYKNINKACSEKLIDKTQKKLLHKFRIKFRNAYSHSEKTKTFEKESIHVDTMTTENGNIEIGESGNPEIAKLIVGQGIIQANKAQEDAPYYFLELDKIVRDIRLNLFNK